MNKEKPRPEGFDYSQPDPEEVRCPVCNKDGMNRTGLKPISWVGASGTTAYATPCPNECKKGLGGAVSNNQFKTLPKSIQSRIKL